MGTKQEAWRACIRMLGAVPLDQLDLLERPYASSRSAFPHDLCASAGVSSRATIDIANAHSVAPFCRRSLYCPVHVRLSRSHNRFPPFLHRSAHQLTSCFHQSRAKASVLFLYHATFVQQDRLQKLEEESWENHPTTLRAHESAQVSNLRRALRVRRTRPEKVLASGNVLRGRGVRVGRSRPDSLLGVLDLFCTR